MLARYAILRVFKWARQAFLVAESTNDSIAQTVSTQVLLDSNLRTGLVIKKCILISKRLKMKVALLLGLLSTVLSVQQSLATFQSDLSSLSEIDESGYLSTSKKPRNVSINSHVVYCTSESV